MGRAGYDMSWDQNGVVAAHKEGLELKQKAMEEEQAYAEALKAAKKGKGKRPAKKDGTKKNAKGAEKKEKDGKTEASSAA